MTASSNRTKWTLLIGACCLLAAGTAAAQSNPTSCVNDIDCVATPACGGDVCDWNNSAAGMKCKAAGSYPALMDGWCTTTDDCKCKDMGATCDTANLRCTFTRACDAPGAGGCSSTGTAGNGGGGSGGGAGGGAGSSGSAGTSGGGGGDGGGCSISGGETAGLSALFAALGLLVAFRRRSR